MSQVLNLSCNTALAKLNPGGMEHFYRSATSKRNSLEGSSAIASIDTLLLFLIVSATLSPVLPCR